MADERDVYRAAADDRDAPLRDEDPGRAKPPKSPPPQPYHTATALSSLESRLEESEARRIDSEERVQQLEKLVEGLLKSSPEPAAARAGVSEPAVARAGFSEPAAARAGEFTFTPVRSVPLDVPPHTILERSGNTADPLVRSPGGESHSARRDGPSSAVISSRWRGTLPDREGLWTGDNPDRLVTFTTFGKSYLSLLCDISTSDLFTTDRVIQLVATLFVRSTSPKRRQSPHDWAVDTMTDALRDERPHCWTTLMTEVGRRWPDPGFADRVSHDFYGCRQSSSRAYDHVGEWRARYRAFMHNDPSFSLSPLQLATTFYQSLSDVAKREVRAGMLREYRDNSLVTIGRFGRTVPSLEEVTDWAAIADDTGTTSVSTPPIRTATYGAIAKTPRTAPSTPNDDARTQIRRARWMNRAGKWQQAHLWKDRNTWFSPASGGVPASMACFNCGQGGHFSQHCTAERQSPSTVQIAAIAFADMDEDEWSSASGDVEDPQVRFPLPLETDLTRPSSSASALVTHHSCPPADPVGRVKDVASSSFEVQTSSSSSHPTVPANDADQHRLDDSLADIAIDAVEDVLYYADAASRLCHYPGPEVVSSRKAERTASVSSFQILVPSGVSLLASAVPLIDIDEPDRPVEPAIVRARNVIAWTLPSGRVLRCLIYETFTTTWTLHNKTDVQRFLGTVNWMRDHLPHLSKILEPITALMAQSTSWRWNEREQQAFDTVKSLVPAILRPIDGAKVTSGEHKMYLFTDASRVGIGACLASGPNRSQAVPTRFFSAKFNSAQLNYHVTDQEFLAVVSACRAFEQHLIGYPFVIVTDHQALRTIKTQKLRQTPRHIRMCLELSRFDFEFEFIAGKNNTLADSLSRLWEVKEGSHEDQVKENELEDMFFDGERHEFTTPGESLPEERPCTSPSPDRLPPVDFALGPQHDDCEAGSPGYYALKEESQDEDVNGQELGNLFLKEECHEFITPGESLLEERPYTSPSHYEMITTTVRRSRESNRSDIFQRTYEMITTTVRRSRESNRSDEKEAKKWKGGPRWDMPRRGRNRWSAEAVARG
ncbi:BZ3500_MvSof-1268-A1-R1_Chr5-2g07678 [Microbotryum saponariae]|uniref:BZ3500_MvSof-1268-A1-R1_Chr5-2g07678 protein n=1 Tax=Microbotryum saponariae TaxID=289078 RepID=A0A2X0KLX1_9BASI|nr:BZ3500_MvSof-1268-A1-R1_Chr5-2g07678 [Microbotryum saponariae]